MSSEFSKLFQNFDKNINEERPSLTKTRREKRPKFPFSPDSPKQNGSKSPYIFQTSSSKNANLPGENELDSILNTMKKNFCCNSGHPIFVVQQIFYPSGQNLNPTNQAQDESKQFRFPQLKNSGINQSESKKKKERNYFLNEPMELIDNLDGLTLNDKFETPKKTKQKLYDNITTTQGKFNWNQCDMSNPFKQSKSTNDDEEGFDYFDL